MKALARRVLPGWMWRRLRAWRTRRMLAAFSPYTVEHDYGGVRLQVHVADPLGQGWYDHDWTPLPELALLGKGALRPGARVFDLGAHQGIVAMLLARLVGPTGLVVAVEALPHNARLCALNAERNGLPQVRVESVAVSDRPGTVELALELNAHVKSAATTNLTARVPAVTVDELAERHGRPDVLLIDVEGHECHALRGAAATLQHRPDCCVEVHVGCGLELAGGSVDELFVHLPPVDYELFAWTDREQTPVPVAAARDCPAERFFLGALSRRRLERG
jgi:FkbM family methyltransferase